MNLTSVPSKRTITLTAGFWLLAALIATGAIIASRPQDTLAVATLSLCAGIALLGALTGTVAATAAREVRTLREELGHQWALGGLIGPHEGLLPALGGGAVDARRGYAIVALAREIGARRIVELGPGASTALLHLWARAAGHDIELYGIEHDPMWADRVEAMLDELGAESAVVRAPLEPRTVDGWQGHWYAADILDSELPRDIDLLVVDGPPNHTGGNNRFPAWPALRDRMRSGGRIYVDDAARPGERAMVRAWLTSGEVSIECQERDFCVLRVR